MKKNAMLKIAAVLLVAVLLTTCAISSTFAKYASDAGSHVESARVAKWGVTAKLDTESTMFKTTYGPDGNRDVAADTEVVAPGTSGEYTFDLSVTGKPEVAFKVMLDNDTDAANAAGDFITVSNVDLAARLVWYVDGQKSDLTGANAAIAKLAEETFAPNQAATAYENSVRIGWEWPFDDDTTPGKNDVADTALGNTNDLDSLKINVSVYADIVQVDAD